jgi:hypothetical protein
MPNLQTELLLTENSNCSNYTKHNGILHLKSFCLVNQHNAFKNHFLAKLTHELWYIKTLQIIYYWQSTNQWFPKCSSHTCTWYTSFFKTIYFYIKLQYTLCFKCRLVLPYNFPNFQTNTLPPITFYKKMIYENSCLWDSYLKWQICVFMLLPHLQTWQMRIS